MEMLKIEGMLNMPIYDHLLFVYYCVSKLIDSELEKKPVCSCFGQFTQFTANKKLSYTFTPTHYICCLVTVHTYKLSSLPTANNLYTAFSWCFCEGSCKSGNMNMQILKYFL